MSELNELQRSLSKLNHVCKRRGLSYRTWETGLGTWIARATKRPTTTSPGGDYVQICQRTRAEACSALVELVREKFPTIGRPGAKHGNRNASGHNREAARQRLELEQRAAAGVAA